MKQLYVLLFFCLSSVINANAKENTAPLAPAATITGGTTVCQNAASPLITFTGSGGTAPYTFTYRINGGADINVTTTSGNSVTVNAPTNALGTFIYTLLSVEDNTGTTQNQTGTTTVIVTVPPTVDFTFTNDNTCSGTTVQFNSNVSGPSTYTYSWDFGDSTPTSSSQNPSHAFIALGCGTSNFTVTLTITVGSCSVSKTKTISVKQKPDISFTDVNSLFDPFSNCSNASTNPVYTITVGNASTSTCVTSYTINWGDGNTENNVSFPKTHTYNSLGAYSMIITALGTNGCSNSVTYIIKNVSNPLGGLNSPGSTQNLCAPTPNLQFSISNWGTNSLDTTYSINYGDGTTLLLSQTQLNSSSYYNAANPSSSSNYPIPHTYTTSSCPASSFEVKLDVTNVCGTTPFSLGNISILTKPVADFTSPPKACVNTSVLFTNTTVSGYGQNCAQSAIYTWNFGDGSPSITTPLSPPQNISHIYTSIGTYTVTLTVQNFCGTTTITKTICIEPQLTPQFTLNTTSGCTPLAVTATNTTNLANQCATPSYQWSVAYSPTNCGTSITPIPNQTTQNASFNFTEPGNYTITLTTTNSCGSTTATETVIVKKPPTVSIAAINNFCGTANITPVATVASCAPTGSTLTYAWSFPGGNPAAANTLNPGTISYTSAGSYTVLLTVTNECGVSNTASQTFSVNEAPVITNTILSQTICSGSQTAPVILTANPSGTTFSWTAVGTAGVIGFVASGTSSTIPAQTITTTNTANGTVTYTIIPSFNNCVGTPINYVITVNPAPVISTQPVSSTVCIDGNPTLLSVALSSTSVTPSYQWYANTVNSTVGGTAISGAINSSFLPPSNTTGVIYYYCVISLTSGGCSGLTSTVASVTVNPLQTIVTQPLVSQELCVGVSLPTALSVSYNGGVGTATYQWFSNVNNVTTGGTPILGATTASYLPPVYSSAGTYYYYVEISLSGNNCGVTTSNIAQVDVSPDPIITNQPLVTQTLCQGATPISLTVSASGGNGAFLYQWYSNTSNSNTGGILISGATTANYIPPTTTVGTVYYYCTVTQSTPGCSVNSQTAAVIVNTSPSIINQPQPSTVCVGSTPTILSVTASTGSGSPTFQWYSNVNNDTTTGTLLPGETNPTFTPPTNSIGSLYYYCLLTFPAITGNCATIATNTALVTVIPTAAIDQNPVSQQTLCVGATIPTPLTVTPTGGIGTPTYQWYSNTNNTTTGGTPVGSNASSYTPPVFTATGTYYYYVVISYTNGCGNLTSTAAQIDVVSDPTITTQPLASQTVCQSETATQLSVTATGGIGTNYSYQWYSDTNNDSANGTLIVGETNNTFTPSTTNAGTFYYYCVITQPTATGCNATSAAAMITVNIAPAFTTTLTSSIICLGQSPPQSPSQLVIVTNSDALSPNYQWYSNTTNTNSGGTLLTGENNATFNPPATTAGTTYYYCVVTFPTIVGTCSEIKSDTAEVIINQNPIIGPETATICSTTSFSITPTTAGGNIIPTGTTYTWSTPTVNPVGAITNATAETNPQTTISQNLINTSTNPATVTYTVTPKSGTCIGTNFLVTITVNPAINPNVVATNNTCFNVDNASITTNITGGIPPYTITWTGPNSFSLSATSIQNIEPGNYDLTITDTGNCPFTSSYTITEPNDIVITTDSSNNITCFGANNGSIAISVSGGTGTYTYNWTKDTFPFAATDDISNLAPGVYLVTVSDANNCGPKTATFTITEPPVLQVNLVSQTNVDCFGFSTGAINAEVIGGTSPYTYAWSNGETTEDITAIPAGVYNLIVTDSLGCSQNLSVTITQSPEIIINAITTPIVCYGDNNATIDVTISGGVAPYLYQWSNLATSLNLTNLAPDDYIITVTDGIGCIKVLSINIPSPPIFDVAPVVSNISCFGANDGSINLNFVGGIAPVNLVWSDGSTSGTSRNNLPPGIYSVVITDSKPCTISRTFTIVEPAAIVLSANVTNPLDCTNGSSGAIDLIIAGGTLPYSFLWTNGATTEDVSGVTAGNYGVTLTDANGCSTSKTYTLIRPAPLEVAVTTQTDANCTTRIVNQSFVAQASGGVPPYQYQWSSGNVSGTNNEIMSTPLNGIVIVTATDAIGCTTTFSVDVNNPVIGTASFEPTSIGIINYGMFAIGDPIQFESTITGDYISVLWDFGDGTFSTEVNPIHTYLNVKDSYTVTQTVTYPFGCVYTQQLEINVEKGYILVVPTAFTPNGDTKNDTYKPVTKALKNIQLDIYDTWGSLIYSEKGEVLLGWDGKIKGVNAENGNYYSKVSAETFYGSIINQNQTFVLIK
ncbi:PKD domain-containing protein [Flavobacterium macrobrachii]|uniref:PKD domain-containing protein n=1 Tax=Flavobacterium macrobrachii TaxID=591204 RepID=UPI003F70FA55